MSKIDYDLRAIRAIAFDVDGVLSPALIPMGDDGVPRRMANIRDGYALQLAAKCGIKLVVISGAESPGVRERYLGLGFKDVYLGVPDKRACLKTWVESEGIMPDEVAYVGDDVPDIAAMRFAGLSVAPADASVDAKRVARYISPCDGGQGVARDLVEQVLRTQRQWPEE